MRYYLFLLIAFPIFSFGQDLSGVWAGRIEVNGTDVPYQMYLGREENGFSGYGMTIMQIEGYEQVGIKTLKIEAKKDKFILEDDELVFNNFSTPGKRMIFYATLSLEENKTSALLTGKFKTRSVDMRDRTSYTGNVELKKLNAAATSQLMAKLEQLKLLNRNEDPSSLVMQTDQDKLKPAAQQKITTTKKTAVELPSTAALLPPAAEINIRRKELIQEFEVNTDSVRLTFYDNGSVDGDTISVLLNNELIVAKELLSTKAIERTIRFPSNSNSMELIMYAESLGSIAPNSGLLIMQSGKNRMEIRFVGDLSKSPAVQIKRK